MLLHALQLSRHLQGLSTASQAAAAHSAQLTWQLEVLGVLLQELRRHVCAAVAELIHGVAHTPVLRGARDEV
jgi:hypothetical protein